MRREREGRGREGGGGGEGRGEGEGEGGGRREKEGKGGSTKSTRERWTISKVRVFCLNSSTHPCPKCTGYLVEVRTRLRLPDSIEILNIDELVVVLEARIGCAVLGPCGDMGKVSKSLVPPLIE